MAIHFMPDQVRGGWLGRGDIPERLVSCPGGVLTEFPLADQAEGLSPSLYPCKRNLILKNFHSM